VPASGGEAVVIDFPVAGVTLPIFVPPLITFVLGCLCATAGVSGGFLLLPIQVGLLGFAGPAVSPTNLLSNVVGMPGGILRYWREGRLDMRLAGVLIAGFLPGFLLGVLGRLWLLPDPRTFQGAVAFLLLYLAWRLLRSLRGDPRPAASGPLPTRTRIHQEDFSWRWASARLGIEPYGWRPLPVGTLALGVGAVAGAYGIGGGALVAPLLITLFRLPVHATAGATLLAACTGSLAGIVYYALLGPLMPGAGVAVGPDWLLGGMFGLGCLAGTWCGARWQRHWPARRIRLVLLVFILILMVNNLRAAFR
jgi:uncharacterized membrane protein YfcA